MQLALTRQSAELWNLHVFLRDGGQRILSLRRRSDKHCVFLPENGLRILRSVLNPLSHSLVSSTLQTVSVTVAGTARWCAGTMLVRIALRSPWFGATVFTAVCDPISALPVRIRCVDWREARVGVRIRCCGQGLRSFFSVVRCSISVEVDLCRAHGESPAVDFLGPSTQVQGRGCHVHWDMSPRTCCTSGATLDRHDVSLIVGTTSTTTQKKRRNHTPGRVNTPILVPVPVAWRSQWSSNRQKHAAACCLLCRTLVVGPKQVGHPPQTTSIFHAFPSRNGHFFHTTRLIDGNLNENDPPNIKFTYRIFCSKVPRLLDETHRFPSLSNTYRDTHACTHLNQ